MTTKLLVLGMAGLVVVALTVPTVAPFLLLAYVLVRTAQTVLKSRATPSKGWTRVR